MSILASTYITLCVSQAGATATQRESENANKYKEIDHRLNFLPVGAETLGLWEESAQKFLKYLDSKLIERIRDPKAASIVFQHLSVAIHRGNAHRIFSCYYFIDYNNKIIIISLLQRY